MCKTWPIDPSFISCSKQYHESDPENYQYLNPNTYGLFESDILREFLAVSSLDFKGNCDNEWTSQFPLFQLIPKDGFEFDNPKVYDEYIIPDSTIFKELKEEYRLFRIDAKEFHYASGNQCCKYFKEAIDGTYCRKNDCRVLLLFLASRNISDCSDSEAFCRELQKVCDAYVLEKEVYKDAQFTARVFDGKRAYIQYVCEMSGFVEFLFPVIVEGKVIAGVILGQRLPRGGRAECFFRTIVNNGSEQGKNMRAKVDEMLRFHDTEHNDPLSAKKLRLIDERLHSLENTENSTLEQQMKDYRSKLDEALKRVCSFFDPEGDIRAFAFSTLPYIESGHDPLDFKMIGDSKQGDRNDEDTIKRIIFNNDVDLTNTGQSLARSISGPKRITVEKNDIFEASSFSFGKYKVLLWCRFSDWTKKHPEQYLVFKKDLLSACHSFFEAYYILQATSAHDRLVSVTRIIGHETKQIIPVICSKLNKHFGLDKIVDLRFGVSADPILNEQTRTAYDIQQRIELLENIYERSTCLYREVSPTKKYCDLHRLVYSIKSLFDEDTISDISQRLFTVDFPPELNNYDIYTDKQMMSHILFNLVDNAKKYGFMGSITRIIVNVNKENRDRPSLSLSVISYGAEIEDTNSIFTYSHRSPKFASGQSEGEGIGLFLVKQYCSLLKYSVSCSSEKLSDINVPLLYAYNNPSIKFARAIKMSPEIERLTETIIDKAILEEVVNKSYKCIDLGRNMLENHLNEETWRNTFTILIPNDSGLNLLKRKKFN